MDEALTVINVQATALRVELVGVQTADKQNVSRRTETVKYRIQYV